LAPLAENPYTTHIPVLMAISRLLPIMRVLELGCGEFSTLTFSNRSVFPKLEYLHSYENDQTWAKAIRERTTADPRITLTTVAGAIADAVPEIDFSQYELVFIDDSTCVADRARTIASVVGNCSADCVLIIHDFEQRVYRAAARPYGSAFSFTSFNPNTGVLWRGAKLRKAALKCMSKSINSQCRRFRPDDVPSWSRLFDNVAFP
jgi:hypothetical protein